MLKKLFLLFFLGFFKLSAQEIKTLYNKKKVAVTRDTIEIEKVSISPSFFKLQKPDGEIIDTSYYKVDFPKGKLIFKNDFTSQDSITVRYFKYPEFLTKTYSIYDEGVVVANEAGMLYKPDRPVNRFVPFEGLNTSGSITRGVMVGNNQNATVNSGFDLQITGKLSDKVSLRASIHDNNIPLQDNGYSQKLDEFDQIFIELFSDKWNIRAGDLFLENRQSRFLNFNKKVQGLSTQFSFGGADSKTDVNVSAALVRGQYAKSNFSGQEGNQGPYKLLGANGELYVLVISGSERVYVNGILLKRGENNDYVIDYNAGEITFTSLFPINSEMRIAVEYQFSDRNYTRFVTYDGSKYQGKDWSVEGYLYSENDIKNQSLQQDLSQEQVDVLKNAGDDPGLMHAQSAYLDSYSANKILYKKVVINSVETFEYSNNPDDELYSVKFTLVGDNQGSYILVNSVAIGKIYQYVESVNNIPQGNYDPIVRLVAPTKLQIATALGKYNPSDKTLVDFELGVSNNDLNLFSVVDDNNNKGGAGKLNFRQRLLSKKWNVDAFGNYQYVHQDFRTVERLYNIEFNRDWNLTSFEGNQRFLINGLDFILPEQGKVTYQFENLDFSKNFSGSRHIINGLFSLKNWNIYQNGSVLSSKSDSSTSEFVRNQTNVRYDFNKNWVGTGLRLENNKEKLVATNELTSLSQKFTEYGAFVGRGDSTKVFVELGYFKRINDSLQNKIVQKVNTSNSYYLKSKLLQTNKSDLSLFVNYRNLDFTDNTIEDQNSLNSRLLYNDQYFNQFVQVTSLYETSSGTIAQQEYTYVEVDTGKGVYMWNDYNNNGIQELEEFEVAPFPDQTKYIRVFLPNQVYLKSHQNKFSQSLILNPISWYKFSGTRKFFSRFYNQTSFLIERKDEDTGDNFNLNPFDSNKDNLLGLNTSFRNSLFFNRGKQKHSTTYTFINNRVKSLLIAGSRENVTRSHQLQYMHLMKKTWLFSLAIETNDQELASENYSSNNYRINTNSLHPKISYLFNKNASLDLFYEYENKENRKGNFEKLLQNRLGISFSYAGIKKFTMNGEYSFFQNRFDGNVLSPVAFQMLEGLQPGKNSTWRLLLQKNLTQFLDINFNYQGRKTETSNVIHTGNIQLRAYF